jgi:hypothetical protein
MDTPFYSLLAHSHPWVGTQHCLRENLGDNEYQCVNDHTGCIYNDGHNGCMFERVSKKQYDSPLKIKSENK